MNIKEVAQLTGLSHQAIYKKIKTSGLVLEKLKDKATGHFTTDGEAKIKNLFGLQEEVEKPVAKDATEVDNQVAKLTTEVEKLRNQVAILETKVTALTEERDFLRLTLERSQHLEAAALAKLPSPPLALPPTAEEKKHGGLRGWFERKRGAKNAE